MTIDPLGYPRSFQTEDEQNFVAESGDNFISETGVVPKTTVEVEIQAPDSFPHGVRDNAQIIFSDGETGQVVQAGSQYDDGDGNNTFQQYLLQVDYGSILLESDYIPIEETVNIQLEDGFFMIQEYN